MIVEKIQQNYPVNELWKSLCPLWDKFPSVQRSPAVGGWALQSTNHSYTDGWGMEFCPYNGPLNIGPTWTPESEKEKKARPIQDYILPTEITSTLLEKLLTQLTEMGLNPRRGRIIKLSPNSECNWHQDGSERYYQARLHIPLITNHGCFFETLTERVHMPADGSFYFAHINRVHRVVNYGNQDRYHFVCHIWDQKNFTRHHRYVPQENLGETFHLDP